MFLRGNRPRTMIRMGIFGKIKNIFLRRFRNKAVIGAGPICQTSSLVRPKFPQLDVYKFSNPTVCDANPDAISRLEANSKLPPANRHNSASSVLKNRKYSLRRRSDPRDYAGIVYHRNTNIILSLSRVSRFARDFHRAREKRTENSFTGKVNGTSCTCRLLNLVTRVLLRVTTRETRKTRVHTPKFIYMCIVLWLYWFWARCVAFYQNSIFGCT